MIVYSCQDLIFSTKIKSTADVLGIVSRPARDAAAMTNRLNRVDDGKANDQVTGVLLDLELGDQALQLLKLVKAHDPAIPVLTFGSHVATDLLHAAREGGADFVMPRSMFTNTLPDILARMNQPAGQSH